MQTDEFTSLFKELASVNATLTPYQLRSALRLSAALQRYSYQRFLNLLSEHSHRPLLLAYLGDGWGASVTETVALQFPGSHVRALRNGKFRHEFLLQRAVCRFGILDQQIVGQIFAELVGLRDGKTAMHVFRGACDFISTPRHLGHQGWATTVYIQDGALHSALSRLFQGRQSLLYSHGQDFGERHAQFENLDIVLCLRCISHCASSAVKWGLQPSCTDGVLDNMFISVAGLRNSSAALIGKASAFVLSQVKFTAMCSASSEGRVAFWRCMDVGPA